MNLTQLKKSREAYAYPPARLLYNKALSPDALIAWGGRRYEPIFPPPSKWRTPAGKVPWSSLSLDKYHRRLLRSSVQQDRADGVLSSIYGGFYATRYGVPTGYSRARVSWLVNGKGGGPGNTVAFLSRAIKNAVPALQSKDIQGALDSVLTIRYIGLSFASKLLMFMAPSQCVVLDRVIATRLRSSKDVGLRAIRISDSGFVTWCEICRLAAVVANKAGSYWTDWDKAKCKWRAVDVERAVFGYSGDPIDLFGSVTIKPMTKIIVT